MEKTKTQKNLENAFDISPDADLVVYEEQPHSIPIEGDIICEEDESSDIVTDNMKKILSDGMKAIDDLKRIAEEDETPRAYEVYAKFLKTMGELNKDLLDVEKIKKANKKENDPSIEEDSDIIFNGLTRDFIRMLRDKK